jgi:hypothetical protein
VQRLKNPAYENLFQEEFSAFPLEEMETKRVFYIKEYGGERFEKQNGFTVKS